MAEAEAGEGDEVVKPVEYDSCIATNVVCFLFDSRKNISCATQMAYPVAVQICLSSLQC
jgi:hypothetical protein